VTQVPETETEVAEAIRDGVIESPAHLPNFSLYTMRITGTGCAYRMGKDEYAWKDASVYLTDEFLKRCNGLPVIFEHPELGMVNSQEFHDRIVGMIVLPYIKGDEVWGVARIYDEATIELLNNKKITSTSPGVVFGSKSDNRKIDFDVSEKILIEGKPAILDHLAICEQGVWDKLGAPSGVDVADHNGDQTMTEDEKKAQEEKDAAEKIRADAEAGNAMPAWAADFQKSMTDRFDAMGGRMDAMEKSRKDESESEEDKKKREEAEAKAKEEKDAQARMDSEEKDRRDAKARLDAVEKAVKDATPAERSDEEAAEMADAQGRCDSVSMMFGKQARGPLAGEAPLAYRRRLVGEFKAHSPNWKTVDLALLPKEAFAIAESQIYTDAQAAARTPDAHEGIGLREIRIPRQGGGYMSEFVGNPDTWMMHFKPPIRQRVASGGLGLKTNGGR
jgi:colicin import membrane protein